MLFLCSGSVVAVIWICFGFMACTTGTRMSRPFGNSTVRSNLP